ncbi:MAG: glycosyltransferase family 4 protein [Sulfurimonas sp.]|nr:glycosyltransferase family 4 protein [Sulfurimonas sp.]
MKTKILLISNMYPSIKNPAYGVFIKNFIDILSKNFNFKKIVIEGRKKNRLNKLKSYIVFFVRIFYNTIFQKNDYIYIHYVSLVSVLLFFIFPFIKGKIILNFHGTDMIGDFSIFKKMILFFTKKISKKVSLIVVPSEFFKKKAIKTLRVEENDIYVYPSSGINLGLFRPLNKIKYKNKFGFDENDFVVGMVSSIYEAKGWKVFLNAMDELKSNVSNLKILIAGRGIEEKELRSYIKKKNLENITVFVGEKTHLELVEIYNALDVFVFPTMLEESLGLVGLEAMACGIPVVGSNIGGLVDYIKNDYNGYLFKVGDSDNLALMILKCKNKHELFQGAIDTASLFSHVIVAEELTKRMKSLY